MARQQTPPQVEGHILINISWDRFLALPMSLASSVLPHLKVYEVSYETDPTTNERVEVVTVRDYDSDIRTVSGERMAAAVVATRLRGGKS